MEGSVRKAGNRIRLNAQLVDAQTGYHLWSERYDREFADVFAVQSELTHAILEALRVEIHDTELDRRVLHRRSPDLRAYEAALRASEHFHRFTRSDLGQARRLFARAVEIDPDYADAIAYLGTTYIIEYALGWDVKGTGIGRAAELAERAMTLDPDSPVANTLTANARLFRGDPPGAVVAAERAVELAPNLDPPHMVLAAALVADGRPLAPDRAAHQSARWPHLPRAAGPDPLPDRSA